MPVLATLARSALTDVLAVARFAIALVVLGCTADARTRDVAPNHVGTRLPLPSAGSAIETKTDAFDGSLTLRTRPP